MIAHVTHDRDDRVRRDVIRNDDVADVQLVTGRRDTNIISNEDVIASRAPSAETRITADHNVVGAC